jgi:hypothetical protein
MTTHVNAGKWILEPLETFQLVTLTTQGDPVKLEGRSLALDLPSTHIAST